MDTPALSGTEQQEPSGRLMLHCLKGALLPPCSDVPPPCRTKMGGVRKTGNDLPPVVSSAQPGRDHQKTKAGLEPLAPIPTGQPGTSRSFNKHQQIRKMVFCVSLTCFCGVFLMTDDTYEESSAFLSISLLKLLSTKRKKKAAGKSLQR